MATLTRQRCFLHTDREAAARCLSCSHYFCRECTQEHDGKMICASCLRKQTTAAKEKKRRFPNLFPGVLLTISLGFLWMMFYALGSFLYRIPSDFHQGTLWKEIWLDEGADSEEEEP